MNHLENEARQFYREFQDEHEKDLDRIAAALEEMQRGVIVLQQKLNILKKSGRDIGETESELVEEQNKYENLNKLYEEKKMQYKMFEHGKPEDTEV